MSIQDDSHRPPTPSVDVVPRFPTNDDTLEDDHSSCHYEDNDSSNRKTRRSRRGGHRHKRQQQRKLAALMAESAARRAAEAAAAAVAAAALAVKGDVCCDSRSTTTTESESSSSCEFSIASSSSNSSSATTNQTPNTPPRIVVNRKRNSNKNIINNYHPYNNYNNSCPTYSPYQYNAGGYFNRSMLPPPDQFLALDCEMVGVGKDGTQSALARVSVMDWYGNVVMDEYIKPGRRKVTDYRSFVSGITPEILQQKAKVDYATCRNRVMTLLRGKILVGHALENDLGILRIDHPWWMLRDTAQYQPFMKVRAGALWPRRLQDLCSELLKRQVQGYGRPHCPREDAMAALDLYKLVATDWENYMMAYTATTTAPAPAVPMTAAQYRYQHQQTVYGNNNMVATTATTTSVY